MPQHQNPQKRTPSTRSSASSDSFTSPSPPSSNDHSHTTACSAYSPAAKTNEDWTTIEDRTERRRIQNRIAQRAYRQKLKERLQHLERKAASSSSPSSPEAESHHDDRHSASYLRPQRPTPAHDDLFTSAPPSWSVSPQPEFLQFSNYEQETVPAYSYSMVPASLPAFDAFEDEQYFVPSMQSQNPALSYVMPESLDFHSQSSYPDPSDMYQWNAGFRYEQHLMS